MPLSVRLLVDDTNKLYFPTCGIAGSSLSNNLHEFNCALSLDDLSEVEFFIIRARGYVDKEWTTKVKVSIAHDCTNSKGNYVAMYSFWPFS